MSLSFTTNQTGANADYSRYVSGQITKTDKVNAPDLLDFTLVNGDGNMVRLQRGTHINLNTQTYGVWFSGYITNDPEPVYLGTKRGVPQWSYSYEATGEEYLLNLKPFGIMAPFTNTTQGAIIKALIDRLTPQGVTFDVSGVQDGQQVPRFIVDPNKHWTEIINSFSKSAHFVFRCRNFVCTYQQQDNQTAPIAIDGNSEHFTPSALQIKAAGDPIINDSIVLGAIEPQNYMEEYFMGDGATATFPLISSVFGVDSTLLLDDDMSGNVIDNTKWTVYDSNAGYLQPYGGTLNVLGGNNDGSLDVYLQSQSLIPLEGNLRCTHGEWDFVSACDGVLGGLWTGQCNGSMSGLIYGIKATPTTKNIIVKSNFDDMTVGSWNNATAVPVTGQSFTSALEATNRDAIETTTSLAVEPGTRYYVSAMVNTQSAAGAVSIGMVFSDGGNPANLQWVPGATQAAGIGWTQISGWLTVPSGVVGASPWLQINATAGSTGTALWSQIYLGIQPPSSTSSTQLNPVGNAAVDLTQSVLIDTNKRYVMRTLYNFQETKRATPTASYRDAAGVIHVIGLPLNSAHFFATTIITELNPTNGVMTNQWTWTSDLGNQSALSAYYVPVASNNLNLTVSGITVSVPMQTSLEVKPAGATSWTAEHMGPNEINAMDGLAPAATIVDSNNGAQTRSSLLGSANYNPGQATLTFFKETAQLVSYLPQKGDLIHLSYRQAGASIGRAQSRNSIAIEAASWGDDGVRSETKRDLSPLPMTSAECELAAVARVNDNCYQHWSGTYTMPSGSWFSGEPVSGVILPFKNLPPQFPSILQAEELTQVKSTLVSENPSEVFMHVMTFGPVSSIDKFLATVKNTNDVFTPQDTAEIPQFIDVSALGLTTVPSLPAFHYVGQDANNWNFQFDDVLPLGCAVEIRYTDSGWGADDGNNLIARVSQGFRVIGGIHLPTQITPFSIPRTVRGKVAFMRCYDTRNRVLYSEDLTQASVWSLSGTASQVRTKDPDGDYAMISKLTFPTGTGGFAPVAYAQQTIPVAAAGNWGTFSVSILGDPGSQVNIGISLPNSTQATANHVVCTGRWQRVSTTCPAFASGTSGNIMVAVQQVSGGSALYITRASFELASATETVYCKTNATPYGATSRFSTGVHTALPMVPPEPTAKGDFSKIDAPVISVILPADLTDVWGCEIRAADNMTVLFKTDLDNATLSLPTITGDTSMVLSTTAPALSKRAFSYWVYTYNLFGEYSTGYNYAATLPDPSVTNLSVMLRDKRVVWTGNNATAYKVYVDTVDTTLTNLSVDEATINTFYPLTNNDFFNLRYIAVTPYDALGPGVTMGGWFMYPPGEGTWPPADLITNRDFESGDTGWTKGTNWGIGQGHACLGSWSAYCAGSLTSPLTTSTTLTSSPYGPVHAGTTYYVRAMIDASSATDTYTLQGPNVGQIGSYVWIIFYDASNNILATVSGNTIVAGGIGWNQSYAQGVAPSGASYAKVGVNVFNQTSGTIFVDDFDFDAMPPTPPGIPVGQVFYKLGNVGPDNNIHISTALNPQGSVLPNQALPISYSTSTTELDISIAASSLLRADGTTLTVPASTQTYSGLSASTTYYFYPFIDASTGALGFTNPSPPSTSQSVTQSMQANFDGRIPLNPFSITTVASGGGTTGGGGGGGFCPEANELVDVDGKGQIKAGDVQAGDMIKGWSFKDSKEVYRRVLQSSSVTCASWYMVNGYRCSPTEPVYFNNQWMIAFRVPGATLDTTKSTMVRISVETDEYDEQNYYLVTGTTPLLIHNIAIGC